MPFRPHFACPAALLAVAVVSAAPVPKAAKPPITAKTADRLRPVHELGSYVYELARGPGGGELTLVRWEKPVEVVDGATLRALRTVVEGKPIHFATTATGDRIAWALNDKTVHVKPTAGGAAVAIDTGNDQPEMRFSPDSKLLATGGYGSQAMLWDADGKLVRAVDCGGKGGLRPVFSPDGKTLAVGNRNDATRLFEAATGIVSSG